MRRRNETHADTAEGKKIEEVYMSKRIALIALFFLLASAGPAMADNCTKLESYLDEAVENVVAAFKEGDTKALK